MPRRCGVHRHRHTTTHRVAVPRDSQPLGNAISREASCAEAATAARPAPPPCACTARLWRSPPRFQMWRRNAPVAHVARSACTDLSQGRMLPGVPAVPGATRGMIVRAWAVASPVRNLPPGFRASNRAAKTQHSHARTGGPSRRAVGPSKPAAAARRAHEIAKPAAHLGWSQGHRGCSRRRRGRQRLIYIGAYMSMTNIDEACGEV